LHEQHLVEEGEQAGGDRRALRREQRQPSGPSPKEWIDSAINCLASGGCIGLSIGCGITGSSICRAAGT